jgi:hypothetical protein
MINVEKNDVFQILEAMRRLRTEFEGREADFELMTAFEVNEERFRGK